MFICFTAFCITYYPAGIAVASARIMRSRILLDWPPLLLWLFGLYFTGCCVNPVSIIFTSGYVVTDIRQTAAMFTETFTGDL